MVGRLPARALNVTNQYDGGELQPVDRAATIDWTGLVGQLSSGGTFWLTVADDHGMPHTRPVFAVVDDGALHTASSAIASKTAFLRSARPVTLATSTTGLDVVWTGRPVEVRESRSLAQVASAYRDTYGWEVEVRADALAAPYGAPTAGPPPYFVFRLDPTTVLGVGTGSPFTGRSTRWDFTS